MTAKTSESRRGGARLGAWLGVFAFVGCALPDARQPGPASLESAPTVARRTGDQEISNMQLTTYLLFPGTCREAMEFYHAIFGGELNLTTVGDSPMRDAFPAAMHAKVVNSRLKSRLVDISASDWLRPAMTPVQGNTVCLYLSGGTADETKSLFDKLAVGADVTDPLRELPFGLYGALNDQFGNRWMFQSAPK